MKMFPRNTGDFIARRPDVTNPSGLVLTIGGLVALLALALFLSIAEDVVMRDPLVVVDQWIAAAVYTWRNPLLTDAMLFFTNLGGARVVVISLVLAGSWMALRGHLLFAAGLLSSVVFGEAIVWGLKGVMHRPRPPVEHALVAAAGASFPSGHSFVAFSLYGFIACFAMWHERKNLVRVTLGCLFLLCAFLIGLSRIYLGVHWLSDVLAAYLLGTAWVATTLTIILSLEKTSLGNSLARSPYPRKGLWEMGLFLLWLMTIVFSYIYDFGSMLFA